VLKGQARSEGLAAIVYHGLLQGLVVILRGARPVTRRGTSTIGSGHPVSRDPQLVQLLANMLLHTQLEIRHVL
jgi:hypothetical protein